MIQFLVGAALLLAPPAEPQNSDDATEVGQLVRQLDAPALAERDEAERKLLALGPRVLPLLPQITDQIPAEIAQRVTRLRQQLLRAQAIAATQPTVVTLHGENLSVAEVLAEIAKQTGNPITDHRAAFGQEQDERRVKVDFDKTPYWQALDEVLDQAGLTLYGFSGRRGAFVVNRQPGAAKRAARACYAGAFRVEPLRFEAQRDLRNEESGAMRLIMEVSWEPRLQPIAVLQHLAETTAVGNTGDAIPPANPRAEPETLVREGFSTAELEIPLALPARTTEKISVLKGKLTALVPGPPVDFRFADLPLAADKTRPKAAEQRQGGTSVTLVEVSENDEVWEASLRLKFEAPPTALESHRSWILDNEAFFEAPGGKRISPGGLEQTRHTKEEIGLKYLFAMPEGPGDLTFVYRTPLVVLELPVEYEFRDLRLP